MTERELKNLPASIHQRLLNKARATNRPFSELLHHYAIERFLYRLSKSPYRDRFVLKGALIFATWGSPLSRPTRDVDLLSYTSNRPQDVVAIVREICGQPVEGDGLVFDAGTVTAEPIKEQAEYPGVRVRFRGSLGDARVNMQVDMGFGDVVWPEPEMVEYPSLLNMPCPELHGYPRETVVAEKAQALVFLGAINTRMKDFYDLWLLASRFDFDGSLLSKAVAQTFTHRETDVPTDVPEALGSDFAQAKEGQWKAFLHASDISDAPQEFARVIEQVRAFLWPVLRALSEAGELRGQWHAGGPWMKVS